MAETNEFAYGQYGDYSGANLYGPLECGFWFDQLAISDTYLNPLFYAILHRAWQEPSRVPCLVADWNTIEGWAAENDRVLVSPNAAALADALAQLTTADVAPHCAGCTAEQCLRCAAVIREFIVSRLERGVDIYIEDA